MSTPCTTCGEPLAADVDRCPTCGALASPGVDETRTLDDAPPWAIPIREPATAGGADRDAGAGRRAALVALVVGVLVLVLVLGAGLLDDEAPDTAANDDAGEVATPDETGGIDGGAVGAGADRDTTTTEVPAPDTTTTTVAETTTTTTAPATTVAPTTTAFTARTPPNGTGSVPALSTSFRGWIAQLRSVPYEAGTDGLADEWDRTRQAAPGVVAARSDDWSAFGDGFWVLVDPGPFDSSAEVRAFCESAGLTAEGACLARELRG